jgi:hypothetical protein
MDLQLYMLLEKISNLKFEIFLGWQKTYKFYVQKMEKFAEIVAKKNYIRLIF